MNTSEKLITIIKRLNFDTKISCENPFLLFIYRIKIIDVYNCSFSLPLDIDGPRSNVIMSTVELIISDKLIKN